jgi:hypothetical protein
MKVVFDPILGRLRADYSTVGGGVSGSGTVNFLSKFTSSSAIGNSRAFEDTTLFTANSPDGNSSLVVLNNNAQIISASSNGVDFGSVQCSSQSSGQCDLIIENSSNGVDSTITMTAAFNAITHDVKISFAAPKYNFHSIPTSASGLSAGDIWSNLGILTIV